MIRTVFVVFVCLASFMMFYPSMSFTGDSPGKTTCSCGADCKCEHCTTGKGACACKTGPKAKASCDCGPDCKCEHCTTGKGACACKTGPKAKAKCDCGPDCKCEHCTTGKGACACKAGPKAKASCSCGPDCKCEHCTTGKGACACKAGPKAKAKCDCGPDCKCEHCTTGKGACACKAGPKAKAKCDCGPDCKCEHCTTGKGACACKAGSGKGAAASGSSKGLFKVSYEADGGDIPLNAIHTWTITVTDAEGKPVTDAEIAIDGGMPAHGHGLPTEPEVVKNLGNGSYLVEGVKFSMPGEWVMTFSIKSGAKEDVVVVEFGL